MAITVVGKENTWQRQMYLDISNLKGFPQPLSMLLSTGVTKNTRSYSLDWHKQRDLVEAGKENYICPY